MLRVLAAFEGAGEVVPRPVADRRRDVGLLDAAADLLEEPVLEAARVLQCGGRVGVLGREVVEDLGVVAVPEPVPGVDARVAVRSELDGTCGRDWRGGGVRHRAQSAIAPRRRRETASGPRGAPGTLLGDVGCPSHRPVARLAVGDPDRGHRGRDHGRRVRRRRPGSRDRPGGGDRPGPHVRLDERGRPAPHASRPAAPGSGAGAARSTGARARRRATASTCGAFYDCDMDVLLFVVEQEGRGACHTGERSCFFRAFGGGAEPGPV